MVEEHWHGDPTAGAGKTFPKLSVPRCWSGKTSSHRTITQALLSIAWSNTSQATAFEFQGELEPARLQQLSRNCCTTCTCCCRRHNKAVEAEQPPHSTASTWELLPNPLVRVWLSFT